MVFTPIAEKSGFFCKFQHNFYISSLIKARIDFALTKSQEKSNLLSRAHDMTEIGST